MIQRLAGSRVQVCRVASIMSSRGMAKAAAKGKKAAKVTHIHDVEAGKDASGYYGRSVEYTDAKNAHSYHTYYDLERTMESERLAQPEPGQYVSDRLTDFAPKEAPAG